MAGPAEWLCRSVPLGVSEAEATTLISSIAPFMTVRWLPEVIVEEDAGVLSDGNLKALARW